MVLPAASCCQQELYPDPKTRLQNIRLFPKDLEDLDDTFELLPLDMGAESGTLPRKCPDPKNATEGQRFKDDLWSREGLGWRR